MSHNCEMTNRPFYPQEQQLSEHEVGVYCSECGEQLEVYAV